MKFLIIDVYLKLLFTINTCDWFFDNDNKSINNHEFECRRNDLKRRKCKDINNYELKYWENNLKYMRLEKRV